MRSVSRRAVRPASQDSETQDSERQARSPHSPQFSLQTKLSKTTPCKETMGAGRRASPRKTILTRRADQRHVAIIPPIAGLSMAVSVGLPAQSPAKTSDQNCNGESAVDRSPFLFRGLMNDRARRKVPPGTLGHDNMVRHGCFDTVGTLGVLIREHSAVGPVRIISQ